MGFRIAPWNHEGEEKEEGPEMLVLYQSIYWYNPMESPGVIDTLSFYYSLYMNVFNHYSVYSLEYIALTITLLFTLCHPSIIGSIDVKRSVDYTRKT